MTKTRDSLLRPRSLRAAAGQAASLSAAMGLSVAMLAPGLAHAQAADEEQTLATVKVEDTAIDPNPNAQLGVPYKARTSGDERRTRPIAETPATITVLTRAQIEESGYTDLVRILDAQPGVTVGTGENGNAFGDRYIIRGQEARSDVFVDGLRDPGMSTRESFAIEQLEISKGPNSSFAGRGTSGGAINAITKAATTDYNFGKAAIGVGTDRYVRTTADVNYSTGNTFAVRGNLLYAFTKVPNRAPADRERKGAALSALFSPSDDLSITLDYYGLRAKENPDLGGYLVTINGVRRPAKNVPVYAQKEDFLKSDTDTFTGRIKYNLSPDVRITNITRYGTADNSYVNHGANQRTTSTGNPAGVYAATVLDNGHSYWQDVRYFASQTNLHINSELFGGKNELIIGAEYTDHKVDSGNFTLTRTGAFNCRTGTGNGALDAFCITDANGQPVFNANSLAGRIPTRSAFASRKWGVETISGYVMDTADLGENLTLFAGARVDHYKFRLRSFNAATGVQTADYPYSDTLLNGHAGITYKLGGGAMIYASVASAADINGGESDTGTSASYGGLILAPNGDPIPSKPERSLNFEVGTKWNLFDEKLLITLAAFQTTKDDVMEGLTGADYTSLGTFNTGKNRVRGIEFDVAGNITPEWSLQGGVTVMDSKILESANSGLAAGSTNVGKALANFAKYQAQMMTRYQFTDQFAMGGAIKYKSRRYGGQPDTAAGFTQTGTTFVYSQPVPAYAVGDLFIEYKINDAIEFRLNANNITDTKYYTAVYRSGSFLYKGDGRQVVGTLNVNF